MTPTPNNPALQSTGLLNLPTSRIVSSSIILPFQVQAARKTAPSFNKFHPVRPPRETVPCQLTQPPLRPAATLLSARPKLFFLVPIQTILLIQVEAHEVTQFSAVLASRTTISRPQTPIRFRSVWLPAITTCQLQPRIQTLNIRVPELIGHLSWRTITIVSSSMQQQIRQPTHKRTVQS